MERQILLYCRYVEKNTFDDNENRLAAAIWSSFVGVLLDPDAA
jgi:hypothetical protein